LTDNQKFGVDIAGLEIGILEIDGLEIAGLEIARLEGAIIVPKNETFNVLHHTNVNE